MMFTIAEVLTYSPSPSRLPMMEEVVGLNVRVTKSLYSNVVSSLVVNRRILASFVNTMGIKLAKSESPIGKIINYAVRKDTLKSIIYTHLQCHLVMM